MSESLFTSETPVVGDASDGVPAIATATTVQFAIAGFVTGIRFYATTTVVAGETYTATLFEVTDADDAVPAGTQLASRAVAGSTIVAGTWNVITFAAVPVSTGILYRAVIHNSAGRYVATAAFFNVALTNGNITAYANGDDPVLLGSMRQGTFKVGVGATDYPSGNGNGTCYFADVVFTTTAPTTSRRRRTMTAYVRGTEGRLNDILTILGTTKASLWPFWEQTGSLVTGISVGDLVSSETAAAASLLEDEFAPLMLPCGLFSYHFHPTGDHHLAGIDSANYTFGTGAVDVAFSVGAWIRPNAIASNTIIAKYDTAGTAREWRFWINAAGKLGFELYDESADTTEIAASTAAMSIGQWVLAIASYDGTETDPLVNLYVNSTLANDGTTTESGAYVAMEDMATPLTIGCSGVTALPANEFHGRIALPFITGKALSAVEVEQLYGLMAPMVGLT